MSLSALAKARFADLLGSLSAELDAEHTADARQNPGKHPNIDRLIELANGSSGPLTVKLMMAG